MNKELLKNALWTILRSRNVYFNKCHAWFVRAIREIVLFPLPFCQTWLIRNTCLIWCLTFCLSLLSPHTPRSLASRATHFAFWPRRKNDFEWCALRFDDCIYGSDNLSLFSESYHYRCCVKRHKKSESRQQSFFYISIANLWKWNRSSSWLFVAD